MNILFLGLGQYRTIADRGIYTDLLRSFVAHGHEVYILGSNPRKSAGEPQLTEGPGFHVLSVYTGRITKTNMIEKGINMMLIQQRYIRAIRTFYNQVKFDLVLYPTPPITFLKVVEYVKKRDGAQSYLMLKDIFPQNAVDIGMMKKTGVKGLLYRYFRNKEKNLYRVSDYIGCMSDANVAYVLRHNAFVDPERVMILPNCIDALDKSVDAATRAQIREKYQIPLDKKVFIYGGNLGKPQGIPFLLECLKKAEDVQDAFFLIVGAGTEYKKIEEYVQTSGQKNVKLMKRLPKEDYETMVGACDVGLIFLDHRFTIPNFPSRLLSYLQAKLPVLAATDVNTDIGQVLTEGGFGWWCASTDADAFRQEMEKALTVDTKQMGQCGYDYMLQNYSADRGYSIIAECCFSDKK